MAYWRELVRIMEDIQFIFIVKSICKHQLKYNFYISDHEY